MAMVGSPATPVGFFSFWTNRAIRAVSYVLAHPVVSFILLPIMICGVFAYRQERSDRLRMEETLKAQKVVFEKQATDIKAANQRVEDRDAVLAKTLEALAKVAAAKPATPVETAHEIAGYLALPSAPEVVAAPVAGAPPQAPPAPGSVIFSPPQAEELRQAAVGCAEDKAKVSACEQDAIDNAAKIKALEGEAQALKAERDAAVEAVKGGSFLKRFKRKAEDVGIGVAVGLAIGYAAHH